MKRLALRPLAVAALLFAARAPLAHAAIDQQNAGQITVQDSNAVLNDGYGQSFMPTFLTLDSASFSLLSANGAGSTIRLDLFQGAGYTSTLLASSAPVTFTNSQLQTTLFTFAAAQTVVPNTTYTFRLTLTAGANTNIGLTQNNGYTRGVLYRAGGTSLEPYDTVFAEGTTPLTNAAPEPSTWALLGLGVGGLGLTLRRRRRASRLA